MAFFIVVWAIMVMFVGLALDMGRAYLAREKLRTAQDAAALAAALQFRPEVRVRVMAQPVITVPCSPSIPIADCSQKALGAAQPIDLPFRPRQEVWEAHGWFGDSSTRCDLGEMRVCLYPPDTCILEERLRANKLSLDEVEEVGRETFQANSRGQFNLGKPLELKVLDDKRGGVRATAAAQVPMSIMRIFGYPELLVSTPRPALAEVTPPENWQQSGEYCSKAIVWWK